MISGSICHLTKLKVARQVGVDFVLTSLPAHWCILCICPTLVDTCKLMGSCITVYVDYMKLCMSIVIHVTCCMIVNIGNRTSPMTFSTAWLTLLATCFIETTLG